MIVPEYAGIPIDIDPISKGGTAKQHPPQGYLLLSEAYVRHHAGVWGGFRSFPPAQAMRRKHKASVGFGARRTYAAQPVTAAVRHGNLKVYLVADPNLGPNIDRPRWPVASTQEPVNVPTDVLRRLIAPRDVLPDHALCPTLKTAGGDSNIYVLLRVGAFVVQEHEFEDWYRSQRSKGKWPSQQSRSKRIPGRPTKQTEPLKNAVLALVREQAWKVKDGIAVLRRLIVERGEPKDVPSADTLGRLVSRLFLETGDPAFRRVSRVRKKQRSCGLPQIPVANIELPRIDAPS
jgi:hypothetical protein